MTQLIAIEGIDGVGKTTLVNALSAMLTEEGYTVQTVTLPTRDTPVGKLIRSLLNTGDMNTLQEYTQRELFILDRVESLQKACLPDVDYIITDRHLVTNAAYLEGAPVLAVEKEMVAKESALGVKLPDLVFVLTAPTEYVLQLLEERRQQEGRLDAYENTAKMYHGNTRYEELVKGGIIPYVRLPILEEDTSVRYTPEQLAKQILNYLTTL